MSDFLVNLARRGAGLSPVIKPPASFNSLNAPNRDVAEMPQADQEPVADQQEKTDEKRHERTGRLQPEPVSGLETASPRTWRQNSDSQSSRQREKPSLIPAIHVETQSVEKGDLKIDPPALENAPKSMELTEAVQTVEAKQQSAMPIQTDPGQVQPAEKVDPLWLEPPLPSSEFESGFESPKQALRIVEEQFEMSARDPQSSDGEKMRHAPEEEVSLENRAMGRDWIKPKPSSAPGPLLLNTPGPESTAPTSVQVHIGTVEVRASQPQTVPPPRPTQPIGFSDYLRARLYLPETMD